MIAPYLNIAPENLIVWDVIEEHLDEAAFLIGTWQDALIAPNYTLDEVEDRVEERLEANLEGLEVGGEPVAEKLLMPALLEAPEPGYATAAALVLLKRGNDRYRDAVLDAVGTTEDEQRDGLVLGLSISEAVGLDPHLKQRFDIARTDDEQAAWLSILNSRRFHPGSTLKNCAASKDPAPFSLAVAALGWHYKPGNAAGYEQFLKQIFNASAPEVQQAAVEVGLLIGMQEAWQACQFLANNPGPNRSKCLPLVGLLSRPYEIQQLFPQLEDPECREQAVWALGLSGSVAAVEQCLPYLGNDNPRVAKLAFEAISHITGLDMEENLFQQDEEPEDDEAILTGVDDEVVALDPVEGLVLPNAAEVKKWWDEHNSEFSHDEKYVMGEQLTAATLVKTLKTGPMRLRNPLAKLLWIRTGGRRRLSTHRFSKQQYEELETLADLQDGELFNYL